MGMISVIGITLILSTANAHSNDVTFSKTTSGMMGNMMNIHNEADETYEEMEEMHNSMHSNMGKMHNQMHMNPDEMDANNDGNCDMCNMKIEDCKMMGMH